MGGSLTMLYMPLHLTVVRVTLIHSDVLRRIVAPVFLKGSVREGDRDKGNAKLGQSRETLSHQVQAHLYLKP